MFFNTGKITDRGFLIGPYCPIYGCAGVLMTLFLSRYQNNILLLFIMAIIICGTLEYFTSYLMEKIFKARWWDYSEKKYNLNGRICLDTLIPFGILGVIVIMFVNPLLFIFLNWIPNVVRIVLGDNTEEITDLVKKVIRERSIIHRRLVKAFPNLKIKLR